jgi:hypothetical protein
MVVSDAKLAANRRNAQKSTGPRTEEGKRNSKLNAVTHGSRAETVILKCEDPQAFEDRSEAWSACLLPGNDVEQNAVDDAVEYSWLKDRTRRAQTARLATNISNAGIEEAKREAEEVISLGRKLFWDHRRPLAVFPHLDMETMKEPGQQRAVAFSEVADDPYDPQRLVVHLQSTAGGCQWMLDRWSELKSILDEGRTWQSPDKLKAVRLLGRHAVEAVDERDVLMVFLACQAMELEADMSFPEIFNDFRTYEKKIYTRRLEGRGIDRLRPNDAAAARLALLDIIERAMAPIKIQAEAHRRRSEFNDVLAIDRLAFDDSPVGERLRRYELVSGRGMARSLDILIKLRRSVVSGSLSVVSGPLSVVSDKIGALDKPIAPNEPTVACENAPNEPTAAQDNVTNEPTAVQENVTNEPTASQENVTNEPTASRKNVTNEPTASQKNVTNEPTAVAGDDNTSAALRASRNVRDDVTVQPEADSVKAGEWIREEVEKQQPIRAERLRILNEEARREAAEAMAALRARRGAQKNNKRHVGNTNTNDKKQDSIRPG